MENNNIIRNYEEAIREIKQAYIYKRYKEELGGRKKEDIFNNYPYFFIVGAGISSKVVKTAGRIIDECKSIYKKSYGEIDTQVKKENCDEYSYWFNKAFPHKEIRRIYLEKLIVGKQIPEEVLKLANILSSKEITNLVVTPNFDKFIYQALNLYGEKNILLSERPENVTKLNINSDSLNILHVHGTYEYYDCCNLKSEINDRAQEDGIFSVKSFLTNISNSMSPIIIGYSGWEHDVIMTALRERLKMPLKYKLYWFCYDEKSYDNIPEWVKYEDDKKKKLREDIVFVLPQKKVKKDNEQELLINNDLQVMDENLSSSDIDTLEAIDIFDEMMKQFEIKLPKIVIDPIDFLSNHYNEDILNSSYKRLLLLGLNNKKEKSNDLISDIKTNIVQNDINNLLKNLSAISNKTISHDENDLRELLSCLEIMIDAYKINKIENDKLKEILLVYLNIYEEIKDKTIQVKRAYCNVKLRQLEIEDDLNNSLEIDKLFNLIVEINRDKKGKKLESFNDVFKKVIPLKIKVTNDEIELYNNLIEICEENNYEEANDIDIKKIYIKLNFNKGVLLFKSNKIEEAIEIYDKVVEKYSNEDDKEIKRLIAITYINKGVCVSKLEKTEKAIEIYDKVVEKYSNEDDKKIKRLIAITYMNKGVCVSELGKIEEAIEIYDKVVEKYGSEDKKEIKRIVVDAYFRKGVCVSKLGKTEEAIEIYDKVVEKYSNEDDKEIKKIVSYSYINKGKCVSELGKIEEAIEIYDKVVEKYGSEDKKEIQRIVVNAYFRKGVCVSKLGKIEEAIEIYDKVVEKYSNEDDKEIKKIVLYSHMNKGTCMNELGKIEEEIEIYDKVVEKYSDEYYEEILEKVVIAYDHKAMYLAKKGDELGALEVYKKIIKSNWINNFYLSDKFDGTKINIAYLLRRTGVNEYNVDIKQLLKYGVEKGEGVALINSALISINEKKYEEALNSFFSIKDNNCLEWWTKSLNDDDKEKYIVIYLAILSGKYHTKIGCIEEIEEIEKKLLSFNLQYIVNEFGKIVKKDEDYKEVVSDLEDKEGSTEVMVSKENIHL